MEIDFQKFSTRNISEGYAYLMELEESIEESSELYRYFDELLAMIHSEKSYVRVRSYRLCCALAQWDTEKKLEASMEEMLSVTADEKPRCTRQFIASLHMVIAAKPHLKEVITEGLKSLDLSGYDADDRELIEDDIKEITK